MIYSEPLISNPKIRFSSITEKISHVTAQIQKIFENFIAENSVDQSFPSSIAYNFLVSDKSKE